MSSLGTLGDSLLRPATGTATVTPKAGVNTRPGLDSNTGNMFAVQQQWSQDTYDKINPARRAEYDKNKAIVNATGGDSLVRAAAAQKVKEYEEGLKAWSTSQSGQFYGNKQAQQSAENFIAAGAQRGGMAAGQQAQLAAQTDALNKQKEAIGTQYANDLANILAGKNNYANAVNQQQDVIQQAALGGWTGSAGALAGQQKAAQLGATDILQDRTAAAQDIFATNAALAQRTQQALANEFAINEQDFNRQLGYNQQVIASANQALQYATGEQKYLIQNAINDYNNKLAEYQNSAGADKLNDEKGWTLAKGLVGAVVGIASAVAAIPTSGATLPGIAVGAQLAAG